MTSQITDQPTPTPIESTTDSGGHERPSSAKRLLRSPDDRYLGGVCGGIAEYFGVDPTLVRLAAVVLALLGGSGLFIYLVAWIIMPKP